MPKLRPAPGVHYSPPSMPSNRTLAPHEDYEPYRVAIRGGKRAASKDQGSGFSCGGASDGLQADPSCTRTMAEDHCPPNRWPSSMWEHRSRMASSFQPRGQ